MPAPYNLLPAPQAVSIGTISPDSHAPGTLVTDWQSIDRFPVIQAAILSGDLGSSGTLDAKLEQAQNSSGGGAKDIAGKSITQLTQSGGGSNQQVLIRCRADELDTAGGFSYVRLSLTIGAARRVAESHAKRALINQTWDHALDAFPETIVLPLAPVQSVTQITYVDGAGATQTLSSSVYQVDAISEPARIRTAPGQSWPATQARMNAVTVRFVAGYGSAASTVPEDLTAAVKLLAADLYVRREPVARETHRHAEHCEPDGLPAMTATLLAPYRLGA